MKCNNKCNINTKNTNTKTNTTRVSWQCRWRGLQHIVSVAMCVVGVSVMWSACSDNPSGNSSGDDTIDLSAYDQYACTGLTPTATIAVYDGGDHLPLVENTADGVRGANTTLNTYDQEPDPNNSNANCKDDGYNCGFTEFDTALNMIVAKDACTILEDAIVVSHSTGADRYNQAVERNLPDGVAEAALYEDILEKEELFDFTNDINVANHGISAADYASKSCPTNPDAFDASQLSKLEECKLITVSDSYKAANDSWGSAVFAGIWVSSYSAAAWTQLKETFEDEVNIMIGNGNVLEVISSHQAAGSGSGFQMDDRTVPYTATNSNVRASILYDLFKGNVPNHFIFAGAIRCYGSHSGATTTGPVMSEDSFPAGEIARNYVVAYDWTAADTNMTVDVDACVHNYNTVDSDVAFVGSSFAAPRVSGLAVRLKAENSALTAVEIAEIIKSTATYIPCPTDDVNVSNDNDTASKDDDGTGLQIGYCRELVSGQVNTIYGHGLINVSAAVAKATE